MKFRLLFTLFIAIGLISCEEELTPEEKRALSVSNPIELFDVKSFIETYPESAKFDSALHLYLSLEERLWDSIPPPPWHCVRNCIQILINEDGTILFDGEVVNQKDIKWLSYSFILNESMSELGPEKKHYFLNSGDTILFSKGVFEVVFKESVISDVQNVVIELREGVVKYKNHVAEKYLGNPYDSLENSEKQELDSVLVNRIIFTKYKEYLDRLAPPPPPPPIGDSN